MPSAWKVHSRRIFEAGILLLLVAPFLGKQLIPAGQTLAGVGLIVWCLAAREFPVGSRRGISPSGWWLAGFCLWAAIAIFANSGSLGESPLELLLGLRYEWIVLFLVGGGAVRLLPLHSPSFQRRLFWSSAGAVIISVVFGLASIHLELPLSENKEIARGRLSNLDGEIISFATALAYFLLILLGVFLYRSKTHRASRKISSIWYLLALSAGAAGLYFAFSRGAMCGFAVGLLVTGVLFSRKLLIAAAVLGTVVGLVSFATKSHYVDFADPMRISHWKTAALTTVAHPVFGVGYKNYFHRSYELKEQYGTFPSKKVMEQGRKWGKEMYGRGHAHCNYLEAFASTGIPGGLLFLGFCGAWLVEAWRSSVCRVVIVPALVAFLVSGLFDSSFFNGETASQVLMLYFGTQAIREWEERLTAPRLSLSE